MWHKIEIINGIMQFKNGDCTLEKGPEGIHQCNGQMIGRERVDWCESERPKNKQKHRRPNEMIRMALLMLLDV